MPSGGYREGSGRPRGSLNKTTLEQSHRLSELAKTYTEDALMALEENGKDFLFSDKAEAHRLRRIIDLGCERL